MTLTWTGERYEAITEYEERGIPKGAGFRWDPEARKWWTTDPARATALAEYATGEAATMLAVQVTERKKTAEESRAVDAAVEVPAPTGRAYMPFQKAGIAYALGRPRTLIADEMGCIDGDTKIHVNRGGIGRLYSVRTAYLHMSGQCRKNWAWEKRIPTMVRALCGDEFHLWRCDKIVAKGKRDTVRIETSGGKALYLTPDHEVKTPKGWTQAGKLRKGSEIIVNGTPKCLRCGSKDGYLLISGKWEHPQADRHGRLREHVLVAEQMLGRAIRHGEVVHHKNGKRDDNRPENLMVLTFAEHHRAHRRHRNLHNGGRVVFLPKTEKIVSVTPGGIRDVYDLVMADPHRNFVANGIVAHNCGKTIEALGVLNATPGAERVLVVCPATLKLNWKREAARWLVGAWRIVVLMPGDPWPDLTGRVLVILNYDILDRWMKVEGKKGAKKTVSGVMVETQWSAVIVDEAHYAKNRAAKRSQYVRALAEHADRLLLLTGTPIVNRPKELYNLLTMLDKTAWGSWYGYAVRYCDAHEGQWGLEADGASNLEELQDRLRSTVMVRRLKKDVLTELPPKFRQVIEIQNGIREDSEAVSVAAKAVKAARAARAAAEEGTAEYEDAVRRLKDCGSILFSEIARVRHETAVKKIPYVVDHVMELLDGGAERLVAFGHHHDVLDGIVAGLCERGIPAESIVQLDGRTKNEERQAIVDRFQTDAGCRVFVGGLTAAGVGITLTAASTVVFAELDWVPGTITQAEDRLHRIGQTDNVVVHHVVVNDSIDAKIAQRVIQKQAVIDAALDDPTGDIGTPDGLLDILENRAEGPVAPVVVRAAKEERGGEKIPLPQDDDPEPPAGAPYRVEPQAELTAEEKEIVLEALRTVAGLCDGARQRDGSGFSKFDAEFGHELATRGPQSRKGWVAALRLVRKYRTQVPGHHGRLETAYERFGAEVTRKKR